MNLNPKTSKFPRLKLNYKLLGLISRIESYFSYISLIAITIPITILLIATYNLIWLALLLQLFFCIPVKYKVWEYYYRISLFFPSIFIWIISLITEKGENTFAYTGILLFLTFLTVYMIFSHTEWKLSLVSTLDTYQLTILLSLAFLPSILPAMKIYPISHQHITGIFSTLSLFLMLNGISTAARRSKITKCIGNVEKFKENLEKACGKEETAHFAKIRFEEFLKHIEAGNFEYAYITLSTGLSEMLEVWRDVKGSYPKVNCEKLNYTHDEIRGAIVHSLPKRERGKHVEFDEDAKKRLNIIKLFRNHSLNIIYDLLYKINKKISKPPTQNPYQ